MFQKSAKHWFIPAALLPLLAITGCGGTGDTTNGLFGGTGTTTLGGTTPSSTPSTTVTPSAATGSLQPNAAPAAAQTGTTAASGQTQTTSVTNGPLAPLSGSYTGTWTAVMAPTPAVAGTAPTTPTAAAVTTVKSAPARSGAFTLKIAHPAKPSKTDLGDVSGAWADLALGGIGKISGTIDQIGMPNEANAVHVVGKVQFPGGKSLPLVVELSKDTVGHLAGATTTDTLSLKKSR